MDITIEQVTDAQRLNSVIFLCRDFPGAPYDFYKGMKDAWKRDFLKNQLWDFITEKDHFLFVAKSGPAFLGFVALKKMAWDSAFFSFDCYSLEYIFAYGDERTREMIKRRLLEYVDNLCREKGARYLTAKINATDTSSAEALKSCGFSVICRLLHLVYRIGKERAHFKPLAKIRPFAEGDLGILKRIARHSMHYDHFHLDPNFSKEMSDRVYESLIENCCNRTLADEVLVAERNSEVVGYVACQIRHRLNKILPLRIGHIRHLAVLNPEGIGCGPSLQEAAFRWFDDRVDIVESSTTDQNTGAVKLGLKCNMDLAVSYLRFSKWF